jgi:hypothetical protein
MPRLLLISLLLVSLTASARDRATELQPRRASTTAVTREYLVTTTADSGPGSLRQAILDMNRDCVFTSDTCAAVFRIPDPVPAEGWFTIQPLSPLPVIVAGWTLFDGATQSTFTGQTNGVGPEILLDGTLAGDASGLSFGAFTAGVANLAICNFAANGIEANTGLIDVRSAYLGLHPSGIRAAGNGWRGIQVNSGSANIADSYLSGNGRSGGYFSTGYTWLEHNFIGTGVGGVPVGNGASGLYYQKSGAYYEYADVHDNVIAYNGHAGVALALNALGFFAANDFYANAGRAIDIQFDGPSLATRFGLPGFGGIVGAPRITSARYHEGVTTIEGELSPYVGGVHVYTDVYVYANPGTKDGGALIGTLRTNSAGTFVLEVPRDLRGQYVSAAEFAMIVYNWDDPAPGTSEIGEPRLVE